MQGIKLKSVYRATYAYLALPLFIFLLSWLDYKFSIVLSLFFAVAFYKIWQGIDDHAECSFSHKMVGLSLLVAIIWCFFAGIGYFYYQSWDYHFRNALFRDLINYEWPVFYPQANTPLVYYIGYWLFPALLAHITNLIGHNATTSFMVGNIFLFIYAVLGVSLVFLHIAQAISVKNAKSLFVALIIFVFFSGLDLIGYLFFQIVEQPFQYHLDWWATFMQYSSMSTNMFWVFNQFIATALVTLLIFNERQIKNFGFLAVLLLFLAPYPTAGVGVLMLAYAGKTFFTAQDKKKFVIDDIFSIPNLIGVFWLLPILFLYFITNSEGMDKLWYIFDFTTPQRLILFMVLEFLLYIALIGYSFRKDVFFITLLVSLLLIPFFRIDQQNNFCMRASEPALILLAIYCIKFLFMSYREDKNRYLRIILIWLLLIGSATPLMEFYRGIHYVLEYHKINLVKDEIYTLDQAFVAMPEFGWDANHQYTAQNYKKDIFWQYLAKRRL